MCLFTHFAAGALTGGIVGGLTGNLVLGAVAGAASHAVLDAIPHYDHPDWRLELAGGVISLILLLLMPFATASAVVGGIFGMVPDLENLFQKLGKMRRDQFIFPSHTGLIPHGKSLGPRTLLWQAVIFVCCFALLGLINPGKAMAASDTHAQPVMGDPVVRVLSSNAQVTRISIEFPAELKSFSWDEVRLENVKWALPYYYDQSRQGGALQMAPRLSVSLAVPTSNIPEASVSGIQWWKRPSDSIVTSELVKMERPTVYRGVPISGFELPVSLDGGILRSMIVEVRHQPMGRYSHQIQFSSKTEAPSKNSGILDEAPASLLNPELFSILAKGERGLLVSEKNNANKGLYSHFDLTDHWVRLSIDEVGLHHLSGQELSSMGVSTDDVDPAKLRLFRGGSFALAKDPDVVESDQPDRVGMTEIPIQVIGAGDGEWNLDDEIRFHAFGTDFWNDRVDTEAGHLEFYNHPYQNEGVYWLTWENTSTSSPIDGAALRVAETSTPANGGDVVNTAKLRLHMEEQKQDSQGVLPDNWAWDNSVYFTKTLSFYIQEPVADSLATFVVDYRGDPGIWANSYVFGARSWVNDDTDTAVETNFIASAQQDSLRMRHVGASDQLVAGNNSISFQSTNPDRDHPMALDSFDIFYWTALDLAQMGGQMNFALWREHAQSDGRDVDLQLTIPQGDEVIFWEVGGLQNASILNGDLAGSQLTCGLTVNTTGDRHFLATTEGQLHSVASGQRVQPLDLRAESTNLNYIVVYGEGFGTPAQNLADFRSSVLPGFSNPEAMAVSAHDIYNNFSGGQKDLRAIRNYLKSVFDAGGGNLKFVCLLGNGTHDHRNYRNQSSSGDLLDLLPSEHRNFYPRNPHALNNYHPYGSDDTVVSFDTPYDDPITPNDDFDVDFPDVAIGRLPATSYAEATDMVNRMIEYSANTEPGMWVNKVMMVTDDGVKPSSYPEPVSLEEKHILQAERLTNFSMPASLDIRKVYANTYEFPPGSSIKPQVRSDINASLNNGTTIYHYIGHGAENNLADEQIFQSVDIANLTNGMERFAFIAFSCDVGVYDSPIRRSMAELFVIPDGGGAIASICASQVSWISSNDELSTLFYENLFPDTHVDPDQTLSQALLQAKAAITSEFRRHNSQRYNLLSDPATSLPHPEDNLEFSSASLDTIRAGARQVAVLEESRGLMLGAGDTYSLLVEESGYNAGYIKSMVDSTVAGGGSVRVPRWNTYKASGSAVFNGHGTMTSDELRVPFKVPLQLRYGNEARLRMVLSGLDGDHVANAPVSAVRSATGPSNDIVGPVINLAFEDNRTRVRVGDVLTATLQDSSSISILGTTPGNSLLLEFDDSGFMSDVTSNFSFDADSYTSGQISLPLPGDLPMGKHLAALHASDVLGNVGNDTISFEIVPASVVGMESITLFPNPTPGPCRLVFDLSDPMTVKWDIYTLSGLRIKTHREELSAGPQIINWDGRDDQGDEIANGTYLYVLRGTVASSSERDITETGKLVIMR